MQQKFINSLKETLEIESHEIKMSDAFRDYDEWNSLGQLSLIAMLDDEYDIQIEMKDFNNLLTVGDLFGYIQSHKK